MTGEVVLSSALRSNLLSLQRTQSSIDKTQGILSTGLKVSSALDNPQNFFASQALKNRSSDLTRLLDGIGQSIQTIKTADAGVTSLTKMVEQAESIVSSAREAVNTGGKVASVTGDAKLSGVTDLTTVTGIAATNAIEFSVKDKDGKAITLSTPSGGSAGVIAIAAGDSIDELVTKINDLTDATGATSPTNGKQLIKAEIDSGGKLKITGLEGVTVGVTFNASTGTAGGSEDQAFASALGFGQVAKITPAGGAASAVKFTATPNVQLNSGTFYTSTTDKIASASTKLSDVMDSNGGATARFDNGASAGSVGKIDITINNKSKVSINYTDATTIQGLVDGINNDASLSQSIKASYDATSGKLSISATSSEVSTLKIGVTGAAGETTAKADFDFGVDSSFSAGGTGGSEGETFVLASAASTLSQYENDYNKILEQIDGLVKDSGYRGVNLINGDDLDTYFNEDRSNKLSTKGSRLTSTGLGLEKADFSRSETIEAAGTAVRSSKTTLRNFGSTLSNSLAVIQTREDFTKNLVSTLDEGSDKLTLADQNEEGAKLLALQTRQSLGVTALSLASQSQQSVLRLF